MHLEAMHDLLRQIFQCRCRMVAHSNTLQNNRVKSNEIESCSTYCLLCQFSAKLIKFVTLCDKLDKLAWNLTKVTNLIS